ncbi:MAG TPA: low molecular weight phosphatase family protein [Chloroflexota bacterium]|jgi:protein-tyrosine-phosphatase|nr:low molecular weight phosphatase family protein [Chloroflexota bacterium]
MATRTVLFLCPHNAAKSVLAEAYCRRLAAERGLDLRVDSAGTEPDAAAAPVVVEALRAEGIDVSAHRPRRVTADDLARAWRVLSLGCDVSQLSPAGLVPERWDDVPSPGQDLEAARSAIRRRVKKLVDEIAPERGRT